MPVGTHTEHQEVQQDSAAESMQANEYFREQMFGG